MKTLTTILLFLFILIQTFSWFVYNAAYELNRNYIAANYCINKDKPTMHCDGKCYLAKQQQKENNQSPQSNDKRERFEVQPFFLPEEIDMTFYKSNTLILFNNVVNSSLPNYTGSVFHPPCT